MISYERRRMELRNCDCIELEDKYQQIHCETADGEMRCEICGRINNKVKKLEDTQRRYKHGNKI